MRRDAMTCPLDLRHARGVPAPVAWFLLLASFALCPTGAMAQDHPAQGQEGVRLEAHELGGEPIRIDGKLDEALYTRFEPASGFIQQEPREGEPASERTEAWIFFDADNLYISARCFDSDPSRMVANEMRRDNPNLFENEHFAIVLDTFHDKRNAYMFYATPLGGMFDGLVTDEGATNRDWNTVWDVKTARDEKGWTVEFAIPFKSLRYGPEGPWGINLRRRVRWKNEFSFLSAIPASFGRRGLNQISLGGTLTGVRTPKNSRTIDFKPYTTGGLETDTSLPKPDDWGADFGADARVNISNALSLDLTYNTDFAQVEDDVQQVNLSRFSVVFPEKRDFFLEGRGLFELGTQPGPRSGSGGLPPNETPIVFFSRRIGLSEQSRVPIQAGARLTAKAAGWNVGALQIRTGEDTSLQAKHSDFSVLRIKRDFLARSTMGIIATRRDDANDTPTNTVYGGDLNLGLGSTVRITGIGALSDSGTGGSDDVFYQGRFEWNTDRYSVEANHVRVEENFLPAAGFVPRENIDRNKLVAVFSPRPGRESLKAVRQFHWTFGFDRITTASTGAFESREIEAQMETEFQTGDFLNFQFKDIREDVVEAFDVAGGALVIPTGSYGFREYEVRYRLGQQRKFSGIFVVTRSGFYGGSKTAFEYNRGRMEISSRLSIEPQVQINRLDTPFGKTTTKLVTGRINMSLSPRMDISGLTQYNSTNNLLATNVRFHWEYRPGSDFYVVYADGRDTEIGSGFPALSTRSFVVKFTRLFRF